MAEEVATNGKEEQTSEAEVKVKPKTEDLPQLEEKIIRQIEYYFGDINLCKDKFLQAEIKLDDGWIPIATMLKFKRLAKLTEDSETIVNALAKSESKLMEISEDKTKIRRNPERPVPEMNEERRKELITRTIYVKGFPTDSQLDELLDFFALKWKIENLIMRNYQDKSKKTWHFKGSVFVVFVTVEAATAFMEEEDFKYKDNVMIRMWQSDYIDMKKKEWNERREKKKKFERDGGEANAEDKAKAEDNNQLPKGTIVEVSGLRGGVSREDLKEKIEGLGIAVAYVDTNKDSNHGWIRLEEKDSAKELMTKLTDDKMTVKDVEITVKLLEGDDEEDYLKKVKAEQMKKRQNRDDRSKNFRRRGRYLSSSCVGSLKEKSIYKELSACKIALAAVARRAWWGPHEEEEGQPIEGRTDTGQGQSGGQGGDVAGRR